MVSIITYDLGNISSWFIGIVTFLGILAALFKTEIINFIKRPRLKIFCSNKPSYAHIVPTQDPNYDAAWLSIGINNLKKTSAENVQVFFNAFNSTSNQKFKEFKNINLHKAFSKETIHKRLSKELPTRWNLCFVNHKKTGPLDLLGSPVEHFITFDLQPTPVELTNLRNGEYRFEIIATCDNSKKRFVEGFEIKFDGQWDSDQDIFFKKHLVIRKLRKKSSFNKLLNLLLCLS